ncbi:hypothetical protein LUZ60_006282 [Juncus effusus]|nr:hypothetical protein LUZ60_006282 [Juncus effusus]
MGMATPNQVPLTPNPAAPSIQTPTQTQTPTPSASKLPIKRKQSPPSDASDQLRSPPPFKFQRIWSESDEIRFLQGLIGCKSQGLVFPRDLNLFYDQFSANMPQPYTRSQLSEKLRRLKNKHKSATARIARKGLDPSRIAPHDRDVLHLCSRLWDPQNAGSSPFFSTTPGVSGNKRRRANPRSLPNNEDGSNSNNNNNNNNNSGDNSEDNEGNFVNSTLSVPIIDERSDLVDSMLVDPEPQIKIPPPNEEPSRSPIKTEPITHNINKINHINTNVNNGEKGKEKVINGENVDLIAKAVLNVFDECLKEAGMRNGEDGIRMKWRAQRAAELDVLARRMRLMVEDSLSVAI